MKKLFFLLILLFPGFFLFSTESQRSSFELDFTTALQIAYSDAKIVFPGNDLENNLISMLVALEVDVDVSDYLTVGAIAGYNWNHFSDSLAVVSLPLSLEIDGQSHDSMIFGINLKSDFFSSGDFSFFAKAEFLYFNQSQQEWDIELPVITGHAISKHTFYQGTLDLVVKYHGFNDFIFFIGPQLNFIQGKLTVSETIEDISAEVELKHRQKNIIGALGGLSYGFGSNWEVQLDIVFFSEFSVTASLFYAF